MNALITYLVTNQIKASPVQLTQIISHVADAPFATALLAVDQPLWGSFWHFDVISPGYRLPAIELALLRATRLDNHWPEEISADRFLIDLRQTIRHPDAGIWALRLAGEPCIVLAGPSGKSTRSDLLGSTTVVWYCATGHQLHAGYRTDDGVPKLAAAIEQRQPRFRPQIDSIRRDQSQWLAQTVEQLEANNGTESLAARLDREILRLRLGLDPSDKMTCSL